jgi:hypothetical protein
VKHTLSEAVVMLNSLGVYALASLSEIYRGKRQDAASNLTSTKEGFDHNPKIKTSV